jgi:hypothetical protein
VSKIVPQLGAQMSVINCVERLPELALVLAGAQYASTPPLIMKPTFDACKIGEHRVGS